MTDVFMPRLSDSMEDGTIIRWLVAEGYPVSAGEELVEIETDKATVAHVAEADGVLRVLAPTGTKCAVGTVIARLDVAATEGSGTAPTPDAAPVAEESAPDSKAPVGGPTPVSDGRNSSLRVTTPLARRAAAMHGVVLDSVAPTGPRGRITQSDVLAAAGIARPESSPPAARPSLSAPSGDQRPEVGPLLGTSPADNRGDVALIAPTPLQLVIAKRMTEANRAIPAFQVQTEVDFDQVIILRRSLKEIAGGQVIPSLNDFVVKAVALALKEVPLANASFTESGFEYHSRVNVGVAVAAEGALVVPTVFDADIKSLGSIAEETRRLAERVRAGTVSPAELSGGTFTISNLGMYGMTAITPVVNPPQAAILGVGAAREVLARVDGKITDKTLVTLTLSCDHRILYGAEAARLLATTRDLLGTPLKLVL
jgi:pyruvate dehydrogenase E2 component (dihydrolipoamide acetyltransferase)